MKEAGKLQPSLVQRLGAVHSNEAKLAIVAESYSAPSQVAATARRHGITRFQLNDWRKAAREGLLSNPWE
ncbi:transposase [Rhizobium binae]|uniref:transposase n=1 Tax=Rhizobium binae TaxID=1138190 RepID=UPI001C8342BA|nr:transposase [Rhizobium binae]